MIAYDKTYLEHARSNLANALDYAVNGLGMDLEDFFHRFSRSTVALKFEHGDSRTLAGTSGIELAWEVLLETDSSFDLESRNSDYAAINHRSEEYWTGWALAYYQWCTALPFRVIDEHVPIRIVRGLYHPYHEMDILQFVDEMNRLYQKAQPDTNLKTFRTRVGLSQSELATLAEIPVRTIQQYEQRQKNINNAKGEYLFRLARVLCCPLEALLEHI